MSSTRNKLIHLLAVNKDQYISGQMLSEKLNVSRSAVWKHMNELKKEGYEIEGKSRLGYRIVKYPEHMTDLSIKRGLTTTWLGKTIIYKDTVSSTQIIAHELAQQNKAHGTTVIANEQTGGKGRLGRNWHSKKDKGMWMSIILRPKISPYDAPQLTLLTATVLADVLKSFDIHVKIKWPNDILINKKKLAGILTEMQAEQDQIQYVVIGIGMNVNQIKEDLPSELHKKSTSLTIETNKEWNIVEIIQAFLNLFERRYSSFIKNGFLEVKQKWETYGYKLGENIMIKTANDQWKAPFIGIASDGALLTKDKLGKETKLYSAEIDWFGEDDPSC